MMKPSCTLLSVFLVFPTLADDKFNGMGNRCKVGGIVGAKPPQRTIAVGASLFR